MVIPFDGRFEEMLESATSTGEALQRLCKVYHSISPCLMIRLLIRSYVSKKGGFEGKLSSAAITSMMRDPSGCEEERLAAAITAAIAMDDFYSPEMDLYRKYFDFILSS